MCDLLAQRSRPQLFSNALPPTVACSALRAIELMLEQPELLAHLRERTIAFREMLAEAGYRPLDGEAAIIPIIVGETAEAIALSERLLDEGVFVTGFGFPVVPEERADPGADVRRARAGAPRAGDRRVPAACALTEPRDAGTPPRPWNSARMPVNIVGLGLLLAGLIFLVMGLGFWGGAVLWIIGVICLISGVGALFMTYQQRRRTA